MGWAEKGTRAAPKKKVNRPGCFFLRLPPLPATVFFFLIALCTCKAAPTHHTLSLQGARAAGHRANDGSAPCDRAAAGRAGGGGRGAVSRTGEVAAFMRLSVHASERTGRGQDRARSPPLFSPIPASIPPPPPSSKNYYELLQVPRGACDAQIKRAYRKLALQFHPVRGEGGRQGDEKKKRTRSGQNV